MSHPLNQHRQQHLEKSRVSRLCGGRDGYASGGAVSDHEIAEKALKSHAAQHKALKDGGKKPKHRGDKPMRAKGGRVKHKGKGEGKTNVNVIVAPHPGAGAGGPQPPIAGLGPKPPMPAAPPPAMPAGPPSAPPMAAKPPMPPGAGMGPPPGAGGPPMMPPMRKRGGGVHAKQHDSKAVDGVGKINTQGFKMKGATTSTLAGPSTDQKDTIRTAEKNTKVAGQSVRAMRNMGGKIPGGHNEAHYKRHAHRAKGGKVNGGINGADHRMKTGIGFRLPVQHSGNKDDTQNIGRGNAITYAKGGKVKDHIKAGGEKQYSQAQSYDGAKNAPMKGRQQYEDGWKAHNHPTDKKRATGGPIYAEGMEGKGMSPKLPGGAKGGLARLAKEKAGNW